MTEERNSLRRVDPGAVKAPRLCSESKLSKPSFSSYVWHSPCLNTFGNLGTSHCGLFLPYDVPYCPMARENAVPCSF